MPCDVERRCSQAKYRREEKTEKMRVLVKKLNDGVSRAYRIVEKITHIRRVNISETSQASMEVRGHCVRTKNGTEIGIEQVTRFHPRNTEECV